MLGKLVLCAVLCLLVNQACMAQPVQNKHNEDTQLISIKSDNALLPCTFNLKQLFWSLVYVLGWAVQVGMMVVKSVFATVKCMSTHTALTCATNHLVPVVTSVPGIVMTFVELWRTVAISVFDVTKSCFFKKPF